MKGIKVIFILIIFVMLVSCSQNDSNKKSELALIKTTNPNPVLLEEHSQKKVVLVANIEHDIESMKELYDVAIVKGDKDVLIAYKVKHLYRFKMKSIEKKLKDTLQKKYPNENFTVSSDYKIFLEAVKLKEKMEKPNYSKEKANKKLKKIIKLKQEMA
ncbi:sporulation protein [Bacillus sp. Bva_UNVM-123]|uniref:sporulation protein n=1 Tax=Bacillus sp. Bva_UNVM-123 TaxID=2829798 RepID=UPI00391FA630